MPLAGALVTAFGTTNCGRVRQSNEDAFVLSSVTDGQSVELPLPATSDRPVLFAVADGMGGENAGEVASAVALDAFVDALSGALGCVAPASALRTAMHHANIVVTEAAELPERAGMGTTLLAALIVGTQAWFASVGDSRAYVLRGADLVQVTKDQSYAQSLIDLGALRADQLAKFSGRHLLMQAIGHADQLRVPVTELTLRRSDTLLLCSDGLWGELDDPTIERIIKTSGTPDSIGRRLVEAANAHGGKDNVTVVVAQISGSIVQESLPGETVGRALIDVPDSPGSQRPLRDTL